MTARWSRRAVAVFFFINGAVLASWVPHIPAIKSRPAIGVVGCALVGLGIANIIPVLFSAAARVPGVPLGRALAAVATIGYLGFWPGRRSSASWPRRRASLRGWAW